MISDLSFTYFCRAAVLILSRQYSKATDCVLRSNDYNTVIIDEEYQEQQIHMSEYECFDVSLPLITDYPNLENSNNYDDTIYNYTIYIRNLDTRSIPPMAFVNVDMVSYLYMEYLNIIELFPKSFSMLEKLIHLSLSHNNLTQIGDGIFSSLHQLQILDLSFNNIKHLSPRFLIGTTSLKDIRLASNSLQEFDGSFLHSDNYMKINLSFNSLANIYFSKNNITTMIPNRSVNELYLSHNNFTKLTEVKMLKNLKILDVSENNITEISLGQVKYFIKLNLSSNVLTDLNIEISSNVYGTELDFSNNNLVNIKFCLLHIENINLRNNKIQLLNDTTCALNHSKLIYLNLGHNFLNESLKYYIYTLKHLLLDHNQICFIPLEFSQQFPSLKFLDVSFNHITKLEIGSFENFPNLEYLDFSHNELADIDMHFHALSMLHTLNLSYNEITNINVKRISSDCVGLTSFCLDGNDFQCENLINFLDDLNTAKIPICKGNTRRSSNIFGIACHENNKDFNLKNKIEEILISKITHLFGTKICINEYFDKDFKRSNFYKYMENIHSRNTFKLNETELLSKFNIGFKNSTFYKYLESFRSQKINPNTFNESFFVYFNREFLNSSFVKYLDSLQKTNETSSIYTFFNTNFEDSIFFKYLESWKMTYLTDGKGETYKVFNNETTNNNNKYYKVLYFQSILLLIVTISGLVSGLFFYKLYYFVAKNEHMENEDIAVGVN